MFSPATWLSSSEAQQQALFLRSDAVYADERPTRIEDLRFRRSQG